MRCLVQAVEMVKDGETMCNNIGCVAKILNCVLYEREK